MRSAALLLCALALAAAAVPAPAPKLDLNSVRASQLEAIPGVGPTTAERILRVRERNGPYRCIEELRAVPRLTESQYAALATRLRVPAPDPRCKQSEAARRRGQPLRPVDGQERR